jgi:hypothetical protein
MKVKIFGKEEGKVTGSGMLGICSRGQKLSNGGLKFILGGQHYDYF